MPEQAPGGMIGRPVDISVGRLLGRLLGILLGLGLVTGTPVARAAGDSGEPGPDMEATASVPVVLSPERRSELADMLHNDCGACHGGRLRGGLGTPLVPEALGRKSAEDLAHVIYYGIPDTAMPPWSRFLTREEALWIAQQLKKGLAHGHR